MIYLSGCVNPNLLSRYGVGFLVTPYVGNTLPKWYRWAADTGCFTGKPFVEAKYFAFLHKKTREVSEKPLFATAPDVLMDAEKTLNIAPRVLMRLRREGYAPALVAQNGMTIDNVPWELIDCLFIGGDTEWKLGSSAACLMREARRRQLWIHMGRVNSFERCEKAFWRGCDSVDGNYVGFGPDLNCEKPEKWMRQIAILEANHRLFS